MHEFSLFKIIGMLGLILICAGMLAKHRATRDACSIFGGTALLLYSISVRDTIFIMLQAVYVSITAFDLIRTKLSGKDD